MAEVVLSHTFTDGPGNVASGEQVMDNLNDIVDQVNGGLDVDNLEDDAVTPAKLQDAGTFTMAGLGVTGAIKIGNSSSTTIERGGSGEISYRSTANIHIFRSAATTGTADGAIYCQSVTQTSARATKRAIKTALGLAAIERLRGVAFTSRLDDRPSLGVIAEEVAEVLPELVSDEGGGLGVNYSGLVAPLIEAVKELSARVRTLEARV